MSKDPHIANIFSAEEEDCLSLEQMAAYQQGKLAGQEKHQVERHLLDCELCALTYESMTEHGAAHIAAGAEEISDRAWERIAAEQQVAAGDRRKRRGAIFWIASAASIALLVTVGYFTMQGPTGSEIARSFRQAMDNTPPRAVPAEAPSGDGIAMVEGQEVEEGPAESAMQKNRPDEAATGKLPFQPSPAIAFEDNRDKAEAIKEMQRPEKSLQYFGGNSGVDAMKGNDVATGKSDIKTSPTLAQAKPTPETKVTAAAPNGNAGPGNQPTPVVAGRLLTDEVKGDMFIEGERNFDHNADDDFAGAERMERDQVTSNPAAGKGWTSTIATAKDAKADPADRSVKSKKTAAPTRATEAVLAEETATAPAKDFDQGIIAYKEGDYREAAKELRKATEQTPSNLDAHIYAADAFLRISQPQAALYHIERVLAVPGSSHTEDAEWYKALAFLQMKDAPKAKAQLEKVVAANGKYKTLATDALNALK